MKVLHRRKTCATAIGVALLVMMSAASPALAQGPLFTRVDTLTATGGGFAAGQVILSGDTAVLGGDGSARVFERATGQDLWSQTATLSASDSTPGFGINVATDGTTVVVGASGAAFVFQRGGSGWQEVAKLTGAVNAETFGTAVAVSGTTVIVGAPNRGYDETLITGPGRVYVFEESGTQAWTQAALLNGRAFIPGNPNRIDDFGHSIAIDADTIAVGAHSPRGVMLDTSIPLGYVFGRNQEGVGAWGLVKEVTLLPPPITSAFDAIQPQVAISGDTIVMGSFRPGLARIFERNHGGPDAWGMVATLRPDGVPLDYMTVTRVGISGDKVLVITNFAQGDLLRGAYVFSRNQGGQGRWGEVGHITDGTRGIANGAALDGDTIIAGLATEPVGLPLDAYVADTDRDGVRDGIDPCPNDPLNNTAGSCARDSGGTPVLDEYVTADSVEVVSYGNPFVIRATFTNTTETAISNPFFEVTYLSTGNELLNADAGPSGTGATLTADVGDGILSPGESMTVVFDIGLNSSDPFGFLVSLHGSTD